MQTLRLTQEALSENNFRARLRLEGSQLPQEAAAEFTFTMSDQDREDVRWYLEDFLQYPMDPAPAIAARAVARLSANINTPMGRLLGRLPAEAEAKVSWLLS